MLETVDAIHAIAGPFFEAFELVSVVIFSVEYLLRMWACTTDSDYAKPITGRFRFALRPMSMVDLLAVLPWYLPFVGVDARFMRAFRMLRLFRLAKVGRYFKAMKLLRTVVSKKKEELVITLFVVAVLLVVAASVMYFLEHDAQPEAFSSIPQTLWWAVATLTTVGYGDVYPVTSWGRLLAAVIALLGIGLVALPAGILGGAYLEEVSGKSSSCPKCGHDLAS